MTLQRIEALKLLDETKRSSSLNALCSRRTKGEKQATDPIPVFLERK
jgi:hypothetical protein